MRTANDLILHRGLRTQRRALSRFRNPIENTHHRRLLRMTHVIIHLGIIRHHIRRLATTGDHIMDPRGRWNMLAHHVHHIVHRLHSIQRRTATLRRTCSMGRYSIESELRRFIRQGTVKPYTVLITRMPVQHHIHALEQPVPRHIYFSTAALFRRATIHFDRTFHARSHHLLLDSDARRNRSRSKQMMPAGMTRLLAFGDLSLGHRVLHNARQCIILGKNPNHR